MMISTNAKITPVMGDSMKTFLMARMKTRNRLVSLNSSIHLSKHESLYSCAKTYQFTCVQAPHVFEPLLICMGVHVYFRYMK